MIAAHWPHYFSLDGREGGYSVLPPSTDAVLERLKKLIADLVADGKRVYVVLSAPVHPNFDPRKMIQRTVLAPGFKVDVRAGARAEVERMTGQIAPKVRRMALDSGALVIDPMESLCDSKICPAVTADGQPMYHDWGHLSPSYVRENVRYTDVTMLRSDEPQLGSMR